MEIDIKLSDERHFTDVALIVDRTDFQEEVTRIRKALGIELPLSVEELNRIPTDNETQIINSEVERSRKKLYLPLVFKDVILSVVFRNEVTNNDYLPVRLTSKLQGTFNDDGVTPDETYYLVLSPGARDTDVLKAYQEYRDQLGNETGASQYKYIHQIWNLEKNKPSLKKYREWYFQAEKGSSFSKIAEAETMKCPIYKIDAGHKTGRDKPKECTCFTERAIRTGVETYNSLLGRTRNL